MGLHAKIQNTKKLKINQTAHTSSVAKYDWHVAIPTTK